MVRVMLRVIFVLSLSFNIAFVIHLLGHTSGKKNIQLNLSVEQQEVVNRIHLKFHKGNEKIKEEISEYQTNILDALKKETLDRETVVNCINKIGNWQKQIQLNTIEEIVQVKKYLNKHQCDCLIDGLGQRLSRVSKPCERECCRPKK